MILTPNTEQVNTETNMELYRNNQPYTTTFQLRESSQDELPPLPTWSDECHIFFPYVELR